MNKRSKATMITAVLLTVILVAGIVIASAANAGTKDDPLITLSYLTDKFRPQVMTELKADAAKKAEELTLRFDEKIAELKASGGVSGGTAAPSDAASAFTLVTLSNGQTITCSVGAELLLRVGTATATGSAPAMIDSTDGVTLASGGAVAANHMYMVTIEGNGLKATADTVRVLVRGSYKIS